MLRLFLRACTQFFCAGQVRINLGFPLPSRLKQDDACELLSSLIVVGAGGLLEQARDIMGWPL